MANPFSGGSSKSFPSSGFGVAGGARGAGAGVLRYLVQFAASYDEGNLKDLVTQVETLQKKEDANNAKLLAAEKQRESIRKRLTAARAAESIAGRDITKEIKSILQAESRILDMRKKGVVGIGVQQKLIAQTKRDILATGTITRTQLSTLLHETTLTEKRRQLLSQINGLEARGKQITAERVAIEQQGNLIMQARAQLLPRLAALGLGLVGGVVGAALFQPLIAGGQALIEGVIGAVGDLIVPSRHAGEAVKELGSEINGMVDDDTLTRLQAAADYINSIQPAAGRGQFDTETLALAASADALEKYIGKLEEYNKLVSGDGLEVFQANQVARLIQVLIKTDELAGNLRTVQELIPVDAGPLEQIGSLFNDGSREVADFNYYSELANRIISGLGPEVAQATDNTEELARAAEDAASAFASIRMDALTQKIEDASTQMINGIQAARDRTVDLANAAADQLIAHARAAADAAITDVQNKADAQIDRLQQRLNDLELVPSGRTISLEKRLEALKDAGPSRQTLALAAAIEKLNKAEKERGRTVALAELAEERYLLKLRKRLASETGEINLDKYKGKAKLVAMDAIIRKQQEQNEEQARFNKLLDLQYQFNQRLERQQGETIQEFIERRAQENRRILQEANEIQQDRAKSLLDKQRETLELDLELEENAAKKKELLRQWALEDHLEKLNKQLEASRDADQKALESRRESLQKQLEASQKADQAVLESRREALQKQIEQVRNNAASEIDQIRKTEKQTIESAERRRDSVIATANYSAERAIEAERRRADLAVKLMEQSEDEKLRQAIAGAKSMADLQTISGQISGLNYSAAQLEAIFRAYGLNDAEVAAELGKIRALQGLYQRRLMGFSNSINTTHTQQSVPGGFAKGGIFELSNSMRLGNDIRAGEGGTEMGMIFPNSVVQALRDASKKVGGGDRAYIENLTIPSTNLVDDLWRLKRAVKEIVREEIRRH